MLLDNGLGFALLLRVDNLLLQCFNLTLKVSNLAGEYRSLHLPAFTYQFIYVLLLLTLKEWFDLLALNALGHFCPHIAESLVHLFIECFHFQLRVYVSILIGEVLERMD